MKIAQRDAPSVFRDRCSLSDQRERVYRNCPPNNIFIASGWLNATLSLSLTLDPLSTTPLQYFQCNSFAGSVCISLLFSSSQYTQIMRSIIEGSIFLLFFTGNSYVDIIIYCFIFFLLLQNVQSKIDVL